MIFLVNENIVTKWGANLACSDTKDGLAYAP